MKKSALATPWYVLIPLFKLYVFMVHSILGIISLTVETYVSTIRTPPLRPDLNVPFPLPPAST